MMHRPAIHIDLWRNATERGAMMADELERRVRSIPLPTCGERHVTRYAAEQARRGTEAFLALRSEVAALRADTAALRADIAGTIAHVDTVAENMAIVSATLTRHGRSLDVLMQDVRELRGEATALRRDVEAVNARIDGLRDAVNTRIDELRHDVEELRSGQAELRRDVEELRSGQAELRRDVEELRKGQEELRSGQEALRREVEAINVRLDRMQEGATAHHTELLAAIRALAGSSPPPA
jgi:chromosome segregation ATPase